jgi:hypothetical protein
MLSSAASRSARSWTKCYRGFARGSSTGVSDRNLTALGRLDAKQRQLEALLKGIDAVRPVLSTFENSLSDSQRVPLATVINGSRLAPDLEGNAARRRDEILSRNMQPSWLRHGSMSS